MDLGKNLSAARKKKGMSQEEVAEHLGISRQTVSKWETNETLPDVFQANKLAKLYDMSLDKLMEYDVQIETIEKAIQNTSEETSKKVDWTKMWAQKYPVLATYPEKVDCAYYARELRNLIHRLQKEYDYNELDAMLVLKDILGKTWNKKS